MRSKTKWPLKKKAPTGKKDAQITQRGRGRSQVRDGIKYDSTTEMILYDAFKNVGHDFIFQYRVDFFETAYKAPKLPLLKDGGATAIYMVVDYFFVMNGIEYYVDAKGSIEHATDKSKLLYRLLKHRLYREGKAASAAIVWISRKQIDALLKLSKMKSSNTFWDYFKSIPHF